MSNAGYIFPLTTNAFCLMTHFRQSIFCTRSFPCFQQKCLICTSNPLKSHNCIKKFSLTYTIITQQIVRNSLVLSRTSNCSMLARSRSERCAFVLARSSKLSFFVRSCSLKVRIRVRYSEILAKHINVYKIFFPS